MNLIDVLINVTYETYESSPTKKKQSSHRVKKKDFHLTVQKEILHLKIPPPPALSVHPLRPVVGVQIFLS